MDKQKELNKIATEIEKCRECRKDKTGIAVVGEGSPNSKIMFIGEAPGKTEAATGRPFVGRSGKFLRSNIAAIGLGEVSVYITSPVKYLPIYKTPTDNDIAHGMTHLSKQIKIIKPKILVLMGAVAIKGVLGRALKINETHGNVIKEGNQSFFISYHPAAAIRFLKIRGIFIEDFVKLKKYLDSIS